jgi:hypothetical protein
VGSDPGIQDCQTSPKLKGKTLPLIGSDATDRNEVSISNLWQPGSPAQPDFDLLGWAFGDFGNLL